MNFGKWVKLTRISTQGDYDGNGWVKSYKLGYSYDGVYFRPYTVKTSVFPEHTMVCSPNTPFVLKITHDKVCFWGV